MSRARFAQVLEACQQGRPDMIELYLHAEPLLDHRLEDLATAAKAATTGELVDLLDAARRVLPL